MRAALMGGQIQRCGVASVFADITVPVQRTISDIDLYVYVQVLLACSCCLSPLTPLEGAHSRLHQFYIAIHHDNAYLQTLICISTARIRIIQRDMIVQRV